MRSHLHTQVNRKVSDFIMGEEGKVGSQSAFAAAAFIGATSLAGILLGTPGVVADPDDPCSGCKDMWCCRCEALGYCGPVGDYNCQDEDKGHLPGVTCWWID